MHGRALQREAQLKVENERLQALLRLREQQLFGRKTETSAATAPAASDAPHADSPPRRPRGQQRGGPSPKRRDYSHLPAVVEDKVLPPDQCHCSRCGQPFADFPGTEDSTILEIDVRAHRRVIRRRRYRPTCSCGAHPGIVTAPPPDRLIPKSMLGISILVTVLLDKYLFYRPTYRLLADWRSHGLDLSLGTLTDGLKRMVPLLEPVYEALVKRSQGRTGGGPLQGVPSGRNKVKSGLIVLAFCWARVRRDFLATAELAGSRSLGDGLGGTDRRIVPTQ